MNTPYALLLFVIVVLLMLIGWGLYVQFSEPSAPATSQPAATTQPLVERLRAERERRMRDRELLEHPTTSTTATAPSL